MIGGCRWEEKSFSVLVNTKNTILCKECGIETDGRYKHNGDTLCVGCFSKKPSKFSLGLNTHKDLQYNFTTDMFDGKPIEVRSQGHYKRLLKKYGLANASIKECRQEADFRKRINQEGYAIERKKAAEKLFIKNKHLIRRRNA